MEDYIFGENEMRKHTIFEKDEMMRGSSFGESCAKNVGTSSAGVGCLGMLAVLLQVLFVGLKLGEVGAVASWSWWWVMAPLWGYPGLCIGFLALVLSLMAIVFLVVLFVGLFKK